MLRFLLLSGVSLLGGGEGRGGVIESKHLSFVRGGGMGEGKGSESKTCTSRTPVIEDVLVRRCVSEKMC